MATLDPQPTDASSESVEAAQRLLPSIAACVGRIEAAPVRHPGRSRSRAGGVLTDQLLDEADRGRKAVLLAHLPADGRRASANLRGGRFVERAAKIARRGRRREPPGGNADADQPLRPEGLVAGEGDDHRGHPSTAGRMASAGATMVQDGSDTGKEPVVGSILDDVESWR